MTYHPEMIPFQRQFYRELRESPEGSGNIVRLSDDARKTVVYLGIADPAVEESFEPVGTGFFVYMPDRGGFYLVTADHVTKTLGDGGFCIRLNKPDGTAGNHLIEHANWIRHPTEKEKVDIAVLDFEIPTWAKVHGFPRTGLISGDKDKGKFQTKNIGPGDLAYVVGIFEPLAGKLRNIPAVHTGHVCLIPEDEPIPVGDWNSHDPNATIEVNAYLIEAPNTLPGGSGGPVFVRRSLQTRLFDKNIDKNPAGIDAWMHGSLWLLGVWSDAWFGEPGKIIRLPKGASWKVPLGIGVAVPAQKLIEILEQPALVAKREAAKKMRDKLKAPSKTGTQLKRHPGDDILHTMLNMPPSPLPKPKGKSKAKKTVS